MASPPAWVARWIGLPFVDGGRGPAAFDCYGLARAVLLERRGVELPSWKDYESTQDAAALSAIAAAAKPRFVRVEAPDECDFVLFNVRGLATHVGVCVGGGWFLHCRHVIGSALERLDAPQWAPRVEGFYRVAA